MTVVVIAKKGLLAPVATLGHLVGKLRDDKPRQPRHPKPYQSELPASINALSPKFVIVN